MQLPAACICVISSISKLPAILNSLPRFQLLLAPATSLGQVCNKGGKTKNSQGAKLARPVSCSAPTYLAVYQVYHGATREEILPNLDLPRMTLRAFASPT